MDWNTVRGWISRCGPVWAWVWETTRTSSKAMVEHMAFYPENSRNRPDLATWIFHLPNSNPPIVFGSWTPGGPGLHVFPRPVILFFHGTGGSLSSAAIKCDDMARQLDCNVVALEYPGYGPSTAAGVRPSEERILAAAERLYDAFYDKNQPMILVGISLGAGVAAHLATRRPTATGVVMVAGFTSAISVFSRTVAACLPFADVLRNEACVSNIPCPVIFVHGTEDETVHHDHSETMWTACGSRDQHLRLVPGGTHENMWQSDHRTEIYNAISSLLPRTEST